MKYIILFCLALSCIAMGRTSEKQLTLNLVKDDIRIDGIIDSHWSLADSAQNFHQQQPFYGNPASRKTIAKIATTKEALYCLIIAYDNSGKIKLSSNTLDNSEGDFVSVMFDTYDDKRTAYKFGVSAAGVRTDCRLLDDGRNRDYSWDGVWYAASMVYDWGFVVEMKIPYKSLSFDKNLDQWGVDFDRWIPHNSEDDYWVKYDQREGQRVSKFGTLYLNGFRPDHSGLNLEIYPVGLLNLNRQENGKFRTKPDAGLDIFYNPSPSFTSQITINPDYAQIEADPYSFNISRYESYFEERRPFFTQGNEIFMPSGRESNSGFYSPLELFYSRRIGKKLPGGEEIPLSLGTKMFGRVGDYEYGGFLALTGEKSYQDEGKYKKENRAFFGAARLKKQILENSTLGILFVGKSEQGNSNGVFDIDGAFRQSDWQLSYQVARSFKNYEGDLASSVGFVMRKQNYNLMLRGRYVGEKFDVQQVGYVPWKGTADLLALGGPRWYFDRGSVHSLFIYAGPGVTYEKADDYTDRFAVFGINMNFRADWGLEINADYGKSKDGGVEYRSWDVNFSSWFNTSPDWFLNLYGGYSNTYNFSRNYQASYQWLGKFLDFKRFSNVTAGYDLSMWIERKPDNSIEDITFNARPFISIIPMNYMNLRVYVDNLYMKSTDKLEHVILGFLFSYNFSPKSWIYFAYNEVQEREEDLKTRSAKIIVKERAAIAKIKYLYYF